MPEKRFARRRNSMPDQESLVSTQEQARLLNDPAVPIENVQLPAREQTEEVRSKSGPQHTPGSRREFAADREAA